MITVGAVGITFGVFESTGMILDMALTACLCYDRSHDDFEITKAV